MANGVILKEEPVTIERQADDDMRQWQEREWMCERESGCSERSSKKTPSRFWRQLKCGERTSS
jgi:hypothetical protein